VYGQEHLKEMFHPVVSMHGWKDDVISDNFYVGHQTSFWIKSYDLLK